jgi:teichoic acid transport system ATP-binding protein
VFLVAHQLDSIREMCNRVLWIDEGTLMMDGEPDAVVDAYVEATGK